MVKQAIQAIILRRDTHIDSLLERLLDICLIYEHRKYPMELKIRYGQEYVEKGLEQTAQYMDTLGCDEGWLALFERRPKMKWDDKRFMRKETVEGKTMTIVGL
jgi:hypothetical protein